MNDESGTRPPAAALDQLFSAERSKAFVDAVIAIAMTLLILPLMESAAELGSDEERASQWFTEHTGQIITFVISFVIIGLFWIGHHRVYAHVHRVSNGMLWLTLAWLLTVVWLPVATAFTGRASHGDTTVVLVYMGSMLLTSVLWLLLRVLLASQPQLHDMEGSFMREGVADASANSLLFALAGVVAALVPGVGYYALILLSISGPVRFALTPLFRRWRPSDGTATLTE